MLAKLLFTDLPELFYTINFMPGIKVGRLTLTLISGLFLILAGLIAFYFKKKLSEKTYKAILLGLIVVAWLPLYINFTYNNLYDLSENFKALPYSDSSKRVLRVCNIDNRQDLGGAYCGLFSFMTFIKNRLPAGTEAELLAAPGLDAYFIYYLYPDYKIVDSSDYLLFYRANNYLFKDNTLYKRAGGKNLIIGKYKLLFAKSNLEFILKKL